MKQWQTGGALPVFVGARMQRGFGRFWTQSGNGLGGILRKLFRSAVPFLICGGKAVGRQALKTGVAIGEDVLSGKNVKTASTNRLREAVGSMTEKAISHAQSNMQSGRGIKRKAKELPISLKNLARQAHLRRRKRRNITIYLVTEPCLSLFTTIPKRATKVN
jgi:hypothetical protein